MEIGGCKFYGARIDVQARTTRVVSTREHVATAPRFAIDRALSADGKQTVLAYYARGAATAAHRQAALRDLRRTS